MPQFFIDPAKIEGEIALLKPEETKHLTKVLRYKKGDGLWISDGKMRYWAIVESIGTQSARLKIIEKHPPLLRATSPALSVALLKHDHLEWIIQKGVELGVKDFFLFTSERTVPHYAEQTTQKKMERFEKIALEAAKQTGLIGIPKINPPQKFPQLTTHFKNFSAVLLAWEEEKENSFHSVFQTIDPSRILILIGPEGGFPAHEVEQAEKAGAKKVSLGRQVLRCGTAALVALTLCQYELGSI